MNLSVGTIIGLVFLIVVGVNGFLILALRKNKTRDVSSLELLQKAARQARDPWKSENDDLKELSRLVTDLKEKEDK